MRAAIASFLALFISTSAVVAASNEPKILILPFSSVEEGGSLTIAKGVQHDLAANLAFGKTLVVSPNVPAGPADAEAALKAAHEADATIVIFGHSQTNGNQIRLTGEVLDVASGKPLGGLRATGTSEELFHMQDILGAQAMWALPTTMRDYNVLLKATEIANRPQAPLLDNTAPAIPPGGQQPVSMLPANIQINTYPSDPFPAYPAAYPTAPYYDPYSAYGYYGYPYYGYGFYSPAVFRSGFGRLAFHNFVFHNNGFGHFGGFNGGFGHFHSGWGGGGFNGGGFNGGGFHGGGTSFAGGFGGHR
jgi:TolB-like protein